MESSAGAGPGHGVVLAPGSTRQGSSHHQPHRQKVARASWRCLISLSAIPDG